MYASLSFLARSNTTHVAHWFASHILTELSSQCDQDIVAGHFTLVGGSDDTDPPYYPGTEINGYMPHRGDFVVVSQTLIGALCNLTCINS